MTILWLPWAAVRACQPRRGQVPAGYCLTIEKMSEQYIQGIDIQIDVESFEEFSAEGPEGTTQLNLEVSRNFLDERLRITVGGNIELEDERRRQTSAGDIAGDFSIEYMINPEGSLILKGFRQKKYRDLIDGQLIETGVSLIFTKTYNHFKELFIKKEEEGTTEDVE
jgi:translocation and assembly module TamB